MTTIECINCDVSGDCTGQCSPILKDTSNGDVDAHLQELTDIFNDINWLAPEEHND